MKELRSFLEKVISSVHILDASDKQEGACDYFIDSVI